MITKLRNDLLKARKDNDTLKKSLLGVLLGEIQLEESRTNQPLDDSGIFKHIKKLKKSCDEMAERGIVDAESESAILAEYLPQVMSKSDMLAIIIDQGLIAEIRESDNRMRLMGKVLKVFESDGRPFDGGLVAELLREI